MTHLKNRRMDVDKPRKGEEMGFDLVRGKGMLSLT